MNLRAAVACLLLSTALAAPAAAQHEGHGGHAPSPYVDLQNRPVKALSSEETAELLAGEGMGMALAAELNGLPGPRHVLELAQGLEITETQRRAVEGVLQAMSERAVALGRAVVEGEAALDAAFRERRLEPPALRERIVELGRLRGELRAVHLLAHVETAAVLTPAQTERYARLRGYHGGR